jgi:hypothetical protein
MKSLWLLAVFVVAVGVGCGGEGEGPVEMTPDCQAWVACTEARNEARGITSNLDRYQEGGACWANAEIGHLCATSCTRGLEYLRDRFTDLPEVCAP